MLLVEKTRSGIDLNATATDRVPVKLPTCLNDAAVLHRGIKPPFRSMPARRPKPRP